MTIIYEIVDRKKFVKALEEITGTKAVYMRTPTYAYVVDCFTVTRNGNLEFNDDTNLDKVKHVLTELEHYGFHSEQERDTISTSAIHSHSSEKSEQSEQNANVGLTVAIPLDKVKINNLTNLLEAKESLIKKALGIQTLPIKINEEQVSFPWFSERLDAETVNTYSAFIAALCRMSREQQRISNVQKNVENEKYAFRCFLLRLGFVGEQYKKDRRILLKNLEGSSAFKGGRKQR